MSKVGIEPRTLFFLMTENVFRSTKPGTVSE
jgi:hypothetical protein